MIPRKYLTGAILAGGKSSRMGTDKGMMQFNGEYLIEKAISALKPCVNDLLISSGNRAYDRFGLKRISDIIPSQGPISGIHAALQFAAPEPVFILSCDMPWVTAEVIQHIIDSAEDEKLCIPVHRGELQPLCAVYPSMMAEYFRHCILEKDLSLRRILYQIPRIEIRSEDIPGFTEKYFVNLNTPTDLILNN